MSRPSTVQSVDQIREAFPALRRRRNGQPVAYFDGPGGTQVPRVVADAMVDYLLHHNANAHWEFPTSQETDALVANARATAADFLGATPGEIVFGPNMTTLTFHLARALGRRFNPGDEIVVTELDHHANVDPWRDLARERGLTVRSARMIPETGQIDWKHFESLVNPRTRLVAFGAASNAIGTINDVGYGIGFAQDVEALTFIDAVHYAPHHLVDVRAWGCDFLACSAYKFHGPHAGILYGRGELLRDLDVSKLRPAPSIAPDRFETGTGNFEAMVGTAAAIEFLSGFSNSPSTDRRTRLSHTFAAMHERGEALVKQLWEGLEIIPGVRLYGPPPGGFSSPNPEYRLKPISAFPEGISFGPQEGSRTPTVGFTVGTHSSRDVCRHLAGLGLFASHGHFYAETAVERLRVGGDGLVRVGCACYTTSGEIDRLLDAIRRL